jgi:HPt (histidine-containing phosphotransfer) domain-containing protein
MTDGTPAFEPLSRLFRGDREKVRRTLDIFLRVTREDIQQLDGAYAGHDWIEIARLMHKTKSACLQIGEQAAAAAAVAVECTLSDADARVQAYAMVREELGRVEERVARYLAMES